MSNVLDQFFSLSNPLSSLFGYFTQLQPASWRGVPFVVETDETEAGRRNVEHIYPYRDTPWMEDIGRKARKFQITGFLVGDDVISQRNNMLRAAEQAGPGTLVHPTFGSMTVSLAEPVKFTGDKSHGRVIMVNFSFEESGQKLFPSQQISTGANVTKLAGQANQATSDSLLSQVGSALKEGASVAQQALTTVSKYVGEVQTLGNDATSIFHMVSSLPGSFGRFFNGNAISTIGSITSVFTLPGQINTQVSNLINAGTQARASISDAADKVISTASNL